MNETIDEIQTIGRNSAIAMRKALNDHMEIMMDRAFDAMEVITMAHDDTDKFIADLKGKKKENVGHSSTINHQHPEPKTNVTDPLGCSCELWQSHFNNFLLADINEMISEATSSIQFYLSTGIRYYLERLKDEDFFVLTDLAEMLTVDRKINELIVSCWAIAHGMPDRRKEFKRLYKSKIGKKESGPDKTWELIKIELPKLNHDILWTISGIAGEIHNKVKKSQINVINLFKTRLGKHVTGKSYYLSEVINMCDNV